MPEFPPQGLKVLRLEQVAGVATQGLAQSTQREVRMPLQRCTRHVWPAHVTLVMVMPALEMALMMLVADVPTLHCTVMPTLLEMNKEVKKGGQMVSRIIPGVAQSCYSRR